MVSDIKSTVAATPPAIDTAQRQSGRAESAGTAQPASTSDVVTLTDLAARLQQLGGAVRDLPVVDHARVAELKSALASGEYTVDEHAVADKMSAFEAELGRGKDS